MQLLAVHTAGRSETNAEASVFVMEILKVLMPTARPSTITPMPSPTTPTETVTTVGEDESPAVGEDEQPALDETTAPDVTEDTTQPGFTLMNPGWADWDGYFERAAVPSEITQEYAPEAQAIKADDTGEDPTIAPSSIRAPPCPVFRPRRRWRRSNNSGGGGDTPPDKGYLDEVAKSLYTAEEDTVDERIEKKIKTINAIQTIQGEDLTPPRGVDAAIRPDWESRSWAEVARKVDAGHTQVNVKNDNKPSWLPVVKMKLYDQYFTVQIKALVSAAIDAITDAAFHIDGSHHVEGETYTAVADPVRTVDSTKTLALKSPRSHPKFGVGKVQGMTRVADFPLITHAAIDHIIDINTRKIERCRALAFQAMESLGPPIPPPEPQRQARGALIDRVVVGVTAVAGLFGLSLFGLGGQTAQLTTEVKGLQSDVHSVRQKTAALLQAESAMKDHAYKALEGAGRRFGALRKGLLVEATTNAACETSRSIQRVMENIRQGKLPVEMFRSKTELVSVVGNIKTNFLQPLGLHFIMEDEQLLLRYFCEGHLQERLRTTALAEGSPSAFTKGSMGHAWVNNKGVVLSSVPGGVSDQAEQDKVKLGIDGNSYRGHAKHKVHSKGMRNGFLTKVIDLVTNIQVPVAKSQGQCWEQLKLENNLFSIEDEPYFLEETYTVFRSTDPDTPTEYRSIPNKELKFCDSIPGVPLMTCPRERVRQRGVCEEELVKGSLVEDCLTKLVRWDSKQPFIQQRGRSLEFVVFVPSHLSLTVTCPHSPRRDWSTSNAKGILTVVPPPFCTLHVGELSYLAVAAMAKTRIHGNFQGDLLNQAVQDLANSMELDWADVQESLQRLEDAHVTMREVFDDAQHTMTGQAWNYVQGKLWGITATLLAVVALFGGGTLSVWAIRRYKGLWKSLPERVTQLVTMGETSRARNDQRATIEMKELKRRIDYVEKGHEKTASEIGLLKDMGASLSANALNQTLSRVCEVPEGGLTESQPLMPLTSTMTPTHPVRSVIIPTTSGVGGRFSRR